MFDITKEEIKQLNDSDLRALVGLLCEAELNSIGNKTTDVMYGGNQDEPDGGIDVLVKATKITDSSCYILKNNTVFQVKKPSMSPSKIENEMHNSDGKIKDCIFDLDKINGAYIIVSSGDDLTQITYNKRINKMKEILETEKLNNIEVEFYDCGRIATWVRQYPALICWVKNKVSITTNGWTSYCNWSSRGEVEKDFLYDENTFIYRNDFNHDNKIDIITGINEIRSLLKEEKNSIRLAGLSGVGKTRLAQALFDNKIGSNPLEKELVIYGDISDNLIPDPIVFIQQLQKLDKQIILIIDNCEPNMHNELTRLCQYNDSKISLLTIEYEVKEDDNVDSNNYYLSSTSPEVLKKMLKRDYETISEINIDTIIKCSDGNFRIAIYLAKAIQKEQNVGILNNNDLFSRLFYQGGQVDEELLKVGEVCSIFYSFNGKYDIDDKNNELEILSLLTGIDSLIIYRNVSELIKRQIIQKRGNMRALLPHALANKLAIDFLKKYPLENIIKIINKNERLSLSFYRRIKYLHTSKETQKVGELFISSIKNEEMLNLSKNKLEKIRCISIINPELILKKIEIIDDHEFFSRNNYNFSEWINILCIIAYDEELFIRTINIIIKFALTEKENENYNSIKNSLNCFFHIYLSFTQASVHTRLSVVDELIKSSLSEKNNLGFKLLNEMLSTGPFTGAVVSDYGSQIRDYGLEPTISEWYEPIIDYCKDNLSNDKYYDDFKSIIINSFKDLARMGFYNKLEDIIKENIERGGWKPLWISLLSIKYFDSDKISIQLMKKINDLISILKPITVEEKIDIYLGTNKRIFLDMDETTDDFESVDQAIFELGKELGQNKAKINIYLSMLNDNNVSRLYILASGITEKYTKYDELIKNTLDLFSRENNNAIKIMVTEFMRKFHEKNPIKSAEFLNELCNNNKYSKYYLILQLSYDLEEIDVKRIKKQWSNKHLIKDDLYKIEYCISKLDEKVFLNLLDFLNNNEIKPELIIIIMFRFSNHKEISNELKKEARKYIVNVDFSSIKRNRNNIYNYELSELIKKVFDKDGIEEAKKIFYIINESLDSKNISFYDLENIMIPLIQNYSEEFLNVFINYKGEPSYSKKHFIKKMFNERNVLSYINDSIIINWLQYNNKAEEISYVIEPIYYESEKEYYCWSELGIYMIEKFYENDIVLKNVLKSIFPNSWNNEYSTVLKKRINLYKELINNENSYISEIGNKYLKDLEIRIQYYLDLEKKENEERFNTFE